MGRRTSAAAIAVGLASLLIAACAGTTPTTPGNGGGGGVTPPPPVVNTPPTIDSITVSADRTEVDTEVAVTATVKDAETPVDQLTYAWKADAGTFTGTGASVKWRAPKDQPTPRDYTFTLTVTEIYGTPDATGARPQNVVSASSGAVRVHDSPKELGDMSLRFLGDFANSSVPASTCVRDFSDSCRGKADERGQIEDNRLNYDIVGSALSITRISVAPSFLTATMRVACSFRSRLKRCPADLPAGEVCFVGRIVAVQGDCDLTGVYEQKRWWLCDSHFNNGVILPSMRSFSFGLKRSDSSGQPR